MLCDPIQHVKSEDVGWNTECALFFLQTPFRHFLFSRNSTGTSYYVHSGQIHLCSFGNASLHVFV